MTGNEIREKFLRFFEKRDHERVKSSPLIPQADPTLLFTNAGMVQFKGVFLGEEKRPYSRAATSQKCLRVSGKHNDLEMVGRTPRHHTFFEMLGNFSFGDYFKESAISMAWEFLTVDMGLDPARLWATVYRDDDEAFSIWNNGIGIPEQKILRLGEKDNFWAMGDTGPCGPCSEVHIDRGANKGCGRPECNPECDCGRFLELWNLVFMQYNRDSSGNLNPLPKPSIDTGMGLERIASVMQSVESNFLTDLLHPLIDHVEEISRKEYGAEEKDDVSMRVIADHIRAVAFLLSDGVMPSNEGRGYVLRMILRRAARHGKMLGISEPFLYRVSGTVIDIMGDAYPELRDRRDYIARLTLSEEERFGHTLDYGFRFLMEEIERVKARGETTIPGASAFILYDTYGFPLDLTEEMAAEHGLHVDREGYQRALEEQRQRARAAMKAGAEQVSPVYKEVLERFGPTQFVGYAATISEGKVLAIIKGEKRVEEAHEGETVAVILDCTPFYGEAGGQIGDTGHLVFNENRARVLDATHPVPDLVAHTVKLERGSLREGWTLSAEVDAERRRNIVLNHTATHLLHAALRQVVGDHVKQSGSLVAPDRLRFDYSHFSPLTEREIARVEELVNERIRENRPVQTEVKDIEAALQEGAMALFSEKYGATARVVKISDFSMELCGGTHARATGDIGLFKITHEVSVAAGVRRIEAVTGRGAYDHVRQMEDSLETIREALKAKPGEEAARVQRLIESNKKLEKELREQRQRMASSEAQEEEIKEVKGVKVLVAQLPGMDFGALRSFVDSRKQKLKSGIIVAGTVTDGKVALVAGVTDDLTSKYHAGEIIKEVAGVAGGSGGGRPDMAQAGGTQPHKLKEALHAVYAIIERRT